jgi:hypothetical protein
METKWVLETKEDPETGDILLEFPPELLDQVGWNEGDTLNFSDNGDGSWSITKTDPKNT